MLSPLSATPYWWTDYFCLRQVNVDTCKDVDLDLLQAAINLSHRDKFLRDRASRRVAMKRLYQRHPVDTLCQEGVSKCNGVLGATFILILILYRICSKQSRVQAARIKICNRAAVVRAVKTDRATTKHCPMCPLCHEADHRLTTTLSHCKGDCSTKTMTTANPTIYYRDRETRVVTYPVFEVKGCTNILVVIRRLLLMSGDVELNPGPLDGEDNRACSKH